MFSNEFQSSCILSNSEPLLLEDYTTGSIYSKQKKHLMMSSQRSYGLYSPDNARLELTLVRLELSPVRLCNLLVPYTFACRLLGYFVSQVIIFLAVVKELQCCYFFMCCVKPVIHGFTISFPFRKLHGFC